MVRLRTSTAPTYLRGHVERVATTCATLMKYSSQLARGLMSSGMTAWYGRRLSVQVQGDSQPSGDRVPDARRSRHARARDSGELGKIPALRAHPRGAQGCAA